MGDKISAKRAVKAAGIPVVPGSDGAIEDAETRPWPRPRRSAFPC